MVRRLLALTLLQVACSGGADGGGPVPDAATTTDASAPEGSAGTTGDGSGEARGGAAGLADGGSSTADAEAGVGETAGGAVDADGDGLDDATEASIATGYYPYYSIDPNDACPRHGVLYRVTPHPSDGALVTVWFDVLYERDCGLNGHPGDDEVFGVVIDPDVPPPEGILAIRALSHQGTLCEAVTTCGSLPGCKPCSTAPRKGVDFPVVFASVNKHGGYVSESRCDSSVLCDLGGCTLAPGADEPVLLNAGEPGMPLVTDLTGDGFVTPANGWSEPGLANHDPWGPDDFGGAGNIADDLQDPSFVVDPSGC